MSNVYFSFSLVFITVPLRTVFYTTGGVGGGGSHGPCVSNFFHCYAVFSKSGVGEILGSGTIIRKKISVFSNLEIIFVSL